jgi:hypothetical protein
MRHKSNLEVWLKNHEKLGYLLGNEIADSNSLITAAARPRIEPVILLV